ncbi:MAG TPA: inositol monophosphatase family protein [Gemmatimonadaceae bacterium]|nr:inositol monophosphatase family protein [Gemmatimonadaceae bacterium]
MQANTDAPTEQQMMAAHATRTAVAAARAAAEVIAAAASDVGRLVWIEKGIADFVTDVDRSAESRIAEVVGRDFPEAMILGEELTPEAILSADGLAFVADPLDGTTNFLHGFPHYAVSIGVMNAGELIAGVVLNVPSGELFTATLGGGTFLGGKPVRVSDVDTPSRALIGTGFPFKDPESLDEYARQLVAVSRETAGVRRPGSAALDLADVACGRFDGFWELTLSPWDVAGGILLIREAGGIATDFNGNPASPAQGPVVAGNPDIHPWLLRTLHGAGAA